jgi:hypothetical protein
VQVIAIGLCAAIALFAYRYLLGIGAPPDLIAGNSFVSPWLVVHATAAATALLLGPFQFWAGLRARMPVLHRWNGRVYVSACVVGGLTGFILALGASTGPVSTLGFGSLAIAWLGSTILAWRLAVARHFVDHRQWMIRSFALTLAAVTLRLYVPMSLLLPISLETAYQAISFLCWVPNLIVAELYLRRRTHA